MWNQLFDQVSSRDIAESVEKNGYFFYENVLETSYIEEIFQEIDFHNVLVNTNDLGVVFTKNQKFLTHCLAKSKKTYDLITSRKILDICKEYFTDKYRLVNHRICHSFNQLNMPWHTDNNRMQANRISGKHSLPGLQFIFYLSDVSKSPFQYIKDSHNWSSHFLDIYLTEHLVNQKYRESIVTLEMPKGGMIVCNTHGFHRSLPFSDRHHSRTTLLFQVDQVGSENIGHGEQSYINPAFIDRIEPEIFDYLGFGYNKSYDPFPNTSLANMKIKDIVSLERQLIPMIFKALATKCARVVLPADLIIKIKQKIWLSA